uniref:WD repeat containing protein 74 n=1 Tax=Echinococcus canadensis TaxID=519352 RepID=A0A915EX30_9CEST
MQVHDVITISPLGASKTFDFASHMLVDSGLSFEDARTFAWDTNAGRIFAAGRAKIQGILSVGGSAISVNCFSYESDPTIPIGLSVIDRVLVVGKASGKAFVIDLSNLSLKYEVPVASSLSVCKSYQKYMICGGKDVLFSLWNLEWPTSPVFSAKNVRPDTLDLEVPVWISDASFVEGYEDRLFMTSSKYGDFCVYDVRSGQRRPVSRSAWRVSRKQGKKSVGTGRYPAMLRDLAVTRPVTRCVAYTSAPGVGLRAIAGNAIGDICLLDFRVPHASLVLGTVAESRCKVRSVGTRAAAPPERVKAYQPAAGAITALVCGGAGCANLPHAMPHAAINNQPVVVSASIDRFLRVYHRDSGELLTKIFTKTPISTFLLRDSAKFPMKASSMVEKVDAEGLGEESDELWAGMETLESKDEPPMKRTRKCGTNAHS